MENHTRHLGTAKRIRVRMPLSATRYAWDCRPFGFGRIVAPVASGVIEIASGVQLDLANGELRSEACSQRRYA
jgi:hypothetical protein